MKLEVAGTGGRRANRAGRQLEAQVESVLQTQGFVRFDCNYASHLKRQYRKQAHVGPTIYGGRRKVDFLVSEPTAWPDGLIIECKWQGSSGSADEKYPYLVANIEHTGLPTIIVREGNGDSARARAWLLEQANPDTPLIAVWNVAEFMAQVSAGFLGNPDAPSALL